MAESTLFNKYLSNVRDTLFQPFVPGQKKSEDYRTMEVKPSDPKSVEVTPYHDEEELKAIDWFNLDSVAKIESNNMGDARSKSGALGYFQIKPKVAKDPGYGITPLVTPGGTYSEEDILATPRDEQEDFVRSYLQQARFIFKDDKPKTILSYLEGIPGTKNIVSGKKKISTQGIRYLEKYMLNGDLTIEEIIKSFPQLKNHSKFKRTK